MGRMRKFLQVATLGTCLAAGILLAAAVAGNVRAADTTTTETTTQTTSEPVTVTVEQTTTRQIVLPSPTTTSSSESSSGTPVWVWVLLGILAVALVALIVLLAGRGGKGASAVPDAGGRQRLDAATASWISQGWALESQSADEAVIRRDGERMVITVDAAGRVSTRPYAPPPG